MGTIYRNLHLLAQSGGISQLDTKGGLNRFDGTPDKHYHFRGDKCERVFYMYEKSSADVGLLDKRDLINTRSIVYLCKGHSCQMPVNNPSLLRAPLLEKDIAEII